MNHAPETLPIDGILDALSRCLDPVSANRVVAMEIDPAVQARVDVLAERANQGMLTDDERAEYEAYINLADILLVLQLKARRRLAPNGAS
jgi:hypothetical protein